MVIDTLPFSWRNHEKDILNTFREWFVNGNLVDVTLACDGAVLEVHKMVLSACSKYFRALFEKNRSEHPVVIVGNVNYRDMKAVLDFMYNGSISVPKEHLSDFLKTAKLLQINGLEEKSADAFCDSGTMTQNNDRQLTSHEQLVTNTARYPILRSNSWVNLENDCSQEEISIHDNDESEFMEAVVVKEEPEDSYNEIVYVESQDDRLTPSIVSPVKSFVKGNLNAEQQKPKILKTSDDQVCSTGAPLELVLLPDSISSGQGNQGPTPQMCQFDVEESPKVIQRFHRADHSPRKEMTFGGQISNTSLDTVSEKGSTMQTPLFTSGEKLRCTESNASVSSRKAVSVGMQASSSSLNSASEKVSDNTAVVENQENSSHCMSSASASFQRNSGSFQRSSKRKQLPVKYIQLSEFGMSQLAAEKRSCKSLNLDYDCKCSQKCASRISPSVRSNIFKKFWSFSSYSQQNSFIRNTVLEEDVEVGRIAYRSKKRHRKSFRRRVFRRKYKLGGIVVCQQMYTNTLRVGTERINEALYSTTFPGIHTRYRSLLNGVGGCRLSEKKTREVIDYLEKSFKQASHHSLHGLYTRYRQNTASPVSYHHFAKIFKNNLTSCTRRNDKSTNSDLRPHKAPELPNQTTNFKKVVGQSGSNKTVDQQHAAVCHKHPSVNRKNSHSSLNTVYNAKGTGRAGIRKFTANKVRKIIDHFNKHFSSTSRRDKRNINPSRGDLCRTYKLYKKEVSVPVSFYFYVKVFNLNFRQITGEGSSRENPQFSNKENSNSYQECSVSETSDEQQSSIQTNLSPLNPNETKIIKHFNEIYNNPHRYKRIGFSVKSSDPPLQRMYEIYKKSVTIPFTFAHYVNIFNTHFKSSLSKQHVIRTVNDPAAKNSKTLQGSKAEMTKHPRNIKVSLQQYTTLPLKKIKEVTEHFNEFYNNPSKYESIGFSVKSANPPLQKMYKQYKEKVTLPVNFRHYTKIFCTIYKNSLSGRSKTHKVQCRSANINFAYMKQRRKHLGKVVNTGSHAKRIFEEKKTKSRTTTTMLRQDPLVNIAHARIVEVIDHFKEFYRFVSCHNKSNVPLEFVNKNLPLMKMYNLYRAEAVQPVSYHHFLHIFNVNFKYQEDQLEVQKKEADEMGKSDDKDTNENAEVCNSSIKNKPISRVQKQTSSVMLPGRKARSVISYLEKSFTQASHHSLHGLYTRYKQNAASPVSYHHFAKIFKHNFTSCTKKKWLQSDIYKNAECQNAVVCLNKIDIPLQFQKRSLTSEANEECTSSSNPKQDFVNVETIGESVCSSDKDTRHSSVNGNTAAESAVLCSFEKSCISSTNISDVTERLYAEDISKLLTEMIENIERDSTSVSEANYIAGKEGITDKDESLFNKDLDATQKSCLDK